MASAHEESHRFTPKPSPTVTHETGHTPSTVTHETGHTVYSGTGSTPKQTPTPSSTTTSGGGSAPPAPQPTPETTGTTLRSKVEAGTANEQERAMFESQTAFDRYGNTQQPYYRDSTGRKWTESQLYFADPVEAAALRHAAATGKPAPRVTTYKPEQRPTRRTGDIIFLPSTRETPPLQNRAQIKATTSRAYIQAGLATAEAAKSQGYAQRVAQQHEEFNQKWEKRSNLTPEEAYEYTQERQQLEKRTTPLISMSQTSYERAGARAQQAQTLAEQANKSRVTVAKAEYKAEDEKAYRKFVSEQTGEGYIGGLFKIEEGKSPGGDIPKTTIKLSEPAKVIATDTIAGGVFGAGVGSVVPGAGTLVGGLTGAIGGATVAVGDLAGRYVVLGSEKYNYPVIGQAKQRVEKVREPDFIIPLIDRKVYLTPDQTVGTKSTVEPAPSFDVQLGLELSPEGDYLKVSDAVLVDKTKYRTVSKSEDISKRTQMAGELGAVSGMILAPHVTRYGLEHMPKTGTQTKSLALIKNTPEGEVRQIAGKTQTRGALFQKKGQPIGSRSFSVEAKTITDKSSTLNIAGQKVTLAEKGKAFGVSRRIGTPRTRGLEYEGVKSLTVGDKSFVQAFKTTTTTPSGTSQAYGIGTGSRTGDVVAGHNLGVVLEKGKPPGVYNLAYKSSGFTGSPGGSTTGNWKPAVINTPHGAGAISSTAERTLSVGFTGTPGIKSASLIPKISLTMGSQVGAAPGLTGTILADAAPTTQITVSPTAPRAKEGALIQKQRVRQELTPEIATATVQSVEWEGTRVKGTQQITSTATISGRYSPPIRSTRSKTIPATVQAQIPARVTAQRQDLTPVTTTETLTVPVAPPSFGISFGTPTTPPLTPPFIPAPPTIPLGTPSMGREPRARRSKRHTPRYAPSVSASVFKITTTKKQKATGWTGLETRPIVVNKKTKKTKKKGEPLFEFPTFKFGG